MNKLPTFIRVVLERYRSGRDLPDDYSKYKALESVYAATTKYVGTTFALVVADRSPELKDETWGRIFDSSSLGGWLDAADDVCRHAKKLPDDVKNHCAEYSDYRRHPHKDELDRVAEHLNAVISELEKTGYKLERPSSLNLIRALRCAVTIRNKCAHGAFDSPFFSRIDADFNKALKLILHLIPFSRFTFWGSFGSNALELVEWPPTRRRRTRDAYFWVESPLLSNGFAKHIPFMVYRENSQSTYFLNDRVTANEPEFIDYQQGNVIYRSVKREWTAPEDTPPRQFRPRNYRQHVDVLSSDLVWREVPLTLSGVNATTNETGVYVFTTKTDVGGRSIEVVLYVGKTTNLTERAKSYIRIKKGYSDSRPAIVHMFTTYNEDVRMFFAPVAESRIASVERAIYETTMPEFNVITPPSVVETEEVQPWQI